MRTRIPEGLFSIAFLLAFVAGTHDLLMGQTPVGGTDAGLQPGDLVQVTVWARPELSGEFTVAPDGSVNHPLYRQLRVTGIPVNQVEERLVTFLRQYEANPQVVVQPLYQVAISGPVMQPGIYELPPGTTMSQAITRAGGITENGKRDDVRLIRDAVETELDMTEAEAIRMPIQSGDQIMVRSKGTASAFVRVVLPLLQTSVIVFNIVNIATR
jgi:polysaccharide export outer membrane protein